jgi:hypothetical protein
MLLTDYAEGDEVTDNAGRAHIIKATFRLHGIVIAQREGEADYSAFTANGGWVEWIDPAKPVDVPLIKRHINFGAPYSDGEPSGINPNSPGNTRIKEREANPLYW